MSRFVNPIPQYILSSGDVAAGGTLTFYEPDTDTLLTIYADNDETITLANPVSLGIRGEVPNIFFSASARVVFKDALGNQIFDVQPVSGAGSGSGGVSAWDANATYNQLSIVFGSDGAFYISLTNNNTGNDPALSTDESLNWTRLELLKFWNQSEAYAIQDIVLRGAALYVSQISPNAGIDPITDTTGAWVNLYDANRVPYDGTASGLVATSVKSAIDELDQIIEAITKPLLYKAVLDVSTGDAALPVSPANGDLYIIGIGGTITVSTDGAAPAPTAVIPGQQIVYNGGEARWDLVPLSQIAASISYFNSTSGLAANNVQAAIDEVDAQVDINTANVATLTALVAGLGDGVTYKGSLDVSGGDASLPPVPSGGDLYGIAIGGTITVSANAAAPAPTAVTAGQQIIYNADSVQWDLLASVTSAGEISYNNATSGLAAVTVQGAIDEVAAYGINDLSDVDTTGATNQQFLQFNGATSTWVPGTVDTSALQTLAQTQATALSF